MRKDEGYFKNGVECLKRRIYLSFRSLLDQSLGVLDENIASRSK